GEYWNYSHIRNINYFLQELPNFAGNYTVSNTDTWLGEAYFMRAFTYFTMTQRYGGVPIVDKVIHYLGQDVEDLRAPRDKEADCYNFILADLDKAIELLPPTSPQAGRVNRYAAYGMKARVALWAASIARYGTVQLNGLIGVPAEQAKMFYQTAYDAAVKTADGGYTLYNDGSGDLAASYTRIFLDQASPENIFVRKYLYPEYGHSFDREAVPWQLRGPDTYSSYACPTLDFIEMFDDIDGNPFILHSGDDDAPVLYADRMDIFAKAEPRLRGVICFPGDMLKGELIDVRKGIVEEGNPISEFRSTASFPDTYTGRNIPGSMTIQGASGMGYNEATATGFYLRKWVNPNLAKSDVVGGKSTTTWIEMRYAEILLIRAEAAVELNALGDASKMSDAVACMQTIRDRAGAFRKYTTEAELTIDAVRRERRMELYYENKTFWDLKRWRIFDREVFNREWKVLWPIFVWDEQKYYMKKSVQTLARVTFQPTYYYLQIPLSQIATNPLLEQNPGY
ncbi:MAG: RagB/SusD family nutrient uptake outer membrane protein, partial [Dysgonamonadaceae bacterium]|nr:RagB/SusD family nutrient uptake outer membrane protein [Dysgonamonadaceae bacterium]